MVPGYKLRFGCSLFPASGGVPSFTDDIEAWNREHRPEVALSEGRALGDQHWPDPRGLCEEPSEAGLGGQLSVSSRAHQATNQRAFVFLVCVVISSLLPFYSKLF